MLQDLNNIDTELKDRWWKDVFSTLQQILRKAALNVLQGEEQRKYIFSVTEEEVWNGILNNPDASSNALCIQRDIEGLDLISISDRIKKRYIDMIPSASGDVVDTEAQELLDALKARVLDKLHDEEVIVVKVTEEQINLDDGAQWHETPAGQEYRRSLCDKICAELSDSILTHYEANMIGPSVLFDEITRHLSFQSQKLEMFVERPDAQSSIKGYIESGSRDGDMLPFIMCAPSGAGKTALMAWASKWTATHMHNSIVVVRFLGTSPQSSDVLSLLKSLCSHLVELLNVSGELTASTEVNAKREKIFQHGGVQQYSALFVELMEEFSTSMSHKKLYIFLDSLDQLLPSYNAHLLFWLPLVLPPRVHLVISLLIPLTGQSKLFTQLQLLLEPITPNSKTELSCIYRLQPMSEDSAHSILDKWFTSKDKKLLPSQQHVIMSAFEQCKTPLFLRVATDIAFSWTSFSPPEDCVLASSVRELIVRMFHQFEAVHNAKLVRNTLRYLLTSRFGLSSLELEDILSCDDEVLNSVLQWWVPPIRRLPPLLLKRFTEDLGNYVVERGVNGATVLHLYHREFVEAAQNLYFTSQAEKEASAIYLAKYFNGDFSSPALVPYRDLKGTLKAEDRVISPQPLTFSSNQFNTRKLSELPYQQYKSRNFDLLQSTLYNFQFIEVKFAAKMVDELMDDYTTAISEVAR